jgi:apolipoprotein D and lipocalin family protein
MRKIIVTILALFLSGCHGYPKAVNPVKDFEIEKYLGKWYEIARLDHSFERGLEQVTAEYSLLEDGGVKVINRGFSRSNNKWKEAVGKAYFIRKKDEGYLKVSFFGPFYGSYVIFGLDQENYQYAFISGPDESYLWWLSRTPVLNEGIKAHFIEKAEQMGFSTGELIYVNHN